MQGSLADGTIAATPRSIGRYVMYEEIASGGMASVHLGRLVGPAGFSRTVAIKKMHSHYARDPEFVAMFLDEARLAARIQHPNVIDTLDVVALHGELFLVMEYVRGEPFSYLLRRASERHIAIPPRIVSSIVFDLLQGLHAAHGASSENGNPLQIVHRDVSPQNLMVGSDGVSRILDFGVAKALGRLQVTREGQVKGKLAYMAPEQITGDEVDAQSDLWSAAIVLWEALTERRLFHSDTDGHVLYSVLQGTIEPPSVYNRNLSAEVDAVVLKGLERNKTLRYATAVEFADSLEVVLPLLSRRHVSEWIKSVAGDRLETQARRVAEIESSSSRNLVGSLPEPTSDEPSNALDWDRTTLGHATLKPSDQLVSATDDLPSIQVEELDDQALQHLLRDTRQRLRLRWWILAGILAVPVLLLVLLVRPREDPSQRSLLTGLSASVSSPQVVINNDLPPARSAATAIASTNLLSIPESHDVSTSSSSLVPVKVGRPVGTGRRPVVAPRRPHQGEPLYSQD